VTSLGDHLESALADDAVRVVVLSHVGNTFCAGADLKSPRTGQRAPGQRHFVDIFNMIIDSPKPVIARIAGHALAGGLGLAAACDISIMAASGLIGFTEVRIGVAPAVISVVCLPKMRRADASELFLCGERVSAARAVEVGLINHAVPDDEVDAKVAEIVGKVLRGGPIALARSKELIAKVPEFEDRRAAFAWTSGLSASLFSSPEGQEGMAAFREKRDPMWIPG
jgi:methylglutaconyl-CoA hydratase